MTTLSPRFTAVLLPLCLCLGWLPLPAQVIDVGEKAENFTLTKVGSSETVSLYDFTGKIIVLEWFAYWCPFCASASANTEPGIVQWYETHGGNPDGIPVEHIAVSLDGSDTAKESQFISTYNIKLALTDYDRTLFNRYETESGQPLFVVINGVENSSSNEQWEVLFKLYNYGSYSDPTSALREAIDAVKAAAIVQPTSIFQASESTADLGDGFKYNDLGYLYDGYYPFIWLFGPSQWIYIFDLDQGEAGYYLYDFARSQFGYTETGYYPYYYPVGTDDPTPVDLSK